MINLFIILFIFSFLLLVISIFYALFKREDWRSDLVGAIALLMIICLSIGFSAGAEAQLKADQLRMESSNE